MGLEEKSVVHKKNIGCYWKVLVSIRTFFCLFQLRGSHTNTGLISEYIYYLPKKFRGRQFQGDFLAECHE